MATLIYPNGTEREVCYVQSVYVLNAILSFFTEEDWNNKSLFARKQIHYQIVELTEDGSMIWIEEVKK